MLIEFVIFLAFGVLVRRDLLSVDTVQRVDGWSISEAQTYVSLNGLYRGVYALFATIESFEIPEMAVWADLAMQKRAARFWRPDWPEFF